MTSETGSIASEMSMKMLSDERNLGELKEACGTEGAHLLPETSLQVNPEGLVGVPIQANSPPEPMSEAQAYDQVALSVLYDLLKAFVY